jgi:hypothetical protein
MSGTMSVAAMRSRLEDRRFARFFRAWAFIGVTLGIMLFVVALLVLATDREHKRLHIDAIIVIAATTIATTALAKRVARAAWRHPVIGFPRPPRDKWPSKAADSALGIAGLVALSAIPFWYLVLLSVAAVWSTTSSSPDLFVVFRPVVAATGLIAAGWAFVAVRAEYLAALRAATPTQLAKTHDLRDRAAALEQVMHEATNMAENLQRVIDAEKAMVDELLRDHANAWQLTQLREDQVDALLARFDRAQSRSDRSQLRINVAIALISLIAGYLLNLITPDDLLRVIGR